MRRLTSCRTYSTSNLDLAATGAGDSVNGVTLAAGDRLLVVAQTDAAENGAYEVGASSCSRADDADSAADWALSWYCQAGSRLYRWDHPGAFTLDTDDITITQVVVGPVLVDPVAETPTVVDQGLVTASTGVIQRLRRGTSTEVNAIIPPGGQLVATTSPVGLRLGDGAKAGGHLVAMASDVIDILRPIHQGVALIAHDFARDPDSVSEPDATTATLGSDAGLLDKVGLYGNPSIYGAVIGGVFTTSVPWDDDGGGQNLAVQYRGKRLSRKPGRVLLDASWVTNQGGAQQSDVVVNVGTRGALWWTDSIHIRWGQSGNVMSVAVDKFVGGTYTGNLIAPSTWSSTTFGVRHQLEIVVVGNAITIYVDGVQRLSGTSADIGTLWGKDVFWELYSNGQPHTWPSIHSYAFLK